MKKIMLLVAVQLIAELAVFLDCMQYPPLPPVVTVLELVVAIGALIWVIVLCAKDKRPMKDWVIALSPAVILPGVVTLGVIKLLHFV